MAPHCSKIIGVWQQVLALVTSAWEAPQSPSPFKSSLSPGGSQYQLLREPLVDVPTLLLSCGLCGSQLESLPSCILFLPVFSTLV